MGKFACECGKYVFSDTVLPNDKYYSMFPSEVVWETPEKIEQNFQPFEIEVWECPECKGLTRFKVDSRYRYAYYKLVPETLDEEQP